MTVTNVSEILNAQGDLPDDVLLGRMVLFTITDEPTPRAQLEQWFRELGLDERLLPPEIKPIDAYKKATSEAKNKYALSHDRTAIVLCRDVTATQEFVKRQITREVRDSKARQLSYSKAIDCTFYRAKSVANGTGGTKTEKGSERVHIRVDPTDLGVEELVEVQRIASEIEERYKQYYMNLDGNRLRAVIRDYLKHLNGIELKGGVYFVHISRQPELEKLQTLVRRLGGGCMMHAIPLVDIEREREMVTIAFEREASQQLQEITREVRALKENRKSITPAAFARIKERYDEVMGKAQEHMVTLQVSQDVTGAAAEVALNSLLALQEEMFST